MTTQTSFCRNYKLPKCETIPECFMDFIDLRQKALIIFLLITTQVVAQSPEYQAKKQRLLQERSPFEKIVSQEEPRELVYEDELVIAFRGLRDQAPVHLLIVPKRRINTVNDLNDEDALLLGRMILVAKKIAKEKGIDETGYRLVINTNEDAGQSVFHIHLHLLGGARLGPMVDQTIMKKD
jgi:histidine triad (HIT) family protein